MYKGASTMKKGKKAFVKKYILPIIAMIFFVVYSIWAINTENEVGGVLGIGTAILLVISFIYNWKQDRIDDQKRQELKNKEPQVSADLSEKVRTMKSKGQDIQAIKLVREETGMSLYDAKNYVDSIN